MGIDQGEKYRLSLLMRLSQYKGKMLHKIMNFVLQMICFVKYETEYDNSRGSKIYFRILTVEKRATDTWCLNSQIHTDWDNSEGLGKNKGSENWLQTTKQCSWEGSLCSPPRLVVTGCHLEQPESYLTLHQPPMTPKRLIWQLGLSRTQGSSGYSFFPSHIPLHWQQEATIPLEDPPNCQLL